VAKPRCVKHHEFADHGADKPEADIIRKVAMINGNVEGHNGLEEDLMLVAPIESAGGMQVDVGVLRRLVGGYQRPHEGSQRYRHETFETSQSAGTTAPRSAPARSSARVDGNDETASNSRDHETEYQSAGPAEIRRSVPMTKNPKWPRTRCTRCPKATRRSDHLEGDTEVPKGEPKRKAEIKPHSHGRFTYSEKADHGPPLATPRGRAACRRKRRPGAAGFPLLQGGHSAGHSEGQRCSRYGYPELGQKRVEKCQKEKKKKKKSAIARAAIGEPRRVYVRERYSTREGVAEDNDASSNSATASSMSVRTGLKVLVVGLDRVLSTPSR